MGILNAPLARPGACSLDGCVSNDGRAACNHAALLSEFPSINYGLLCPEMSGSICLVTFSTGSRPWVPRHARDPEPVEMQVEGLVRRTGVRFSAIPWFPWSWKKILISELETLSAMIKKGGWELVSFGCELCILLFQRRIHVGVIFFLLKEKVENLVNLSAYWVL
jgi:hypothetical protein